MKKVFNYRNGLIFVFLLCFAYWIYLIIYSNIQISCDAMGYEGAALEINKYGLKHYFEGGLNREPLYPLLVAFAIKIANLFSVHYFYVQKVMQVLFLFCTQIMALILLSRLKVNNSAKLIAIGYIGFSPALVNSAFSLFSEIVTYPFVIGSVLLASFSLRNMLRLRYIHLFFLALGLSFIVLGATFVKGIFQYVFLIFIMPFIFLIIRSFITKDKVMFRKTCLFVLVTLLSFSAVINAYKYINFKYNGNYDFTTRYGSGLYGNAMKRTQKYSPKMFLVHLASVPGEGVARLFFTPQEVRSVSYLVVEDMGLEALGLSNNEFVVLAKKKFLENPLQYFIFSTIEGMKLFFWESTNIGFVEYPNSLDKIFKLSPFKNGLRLSISILTIVSFFWLFILILKKRRKILQIGNPESEPLQIGLFMLLMIASFISLYSPFSLLTRYALPIVPLYIITISFFTDSLLKRRFGSAKE